MKLEIVHAEHPTEEKLAGQLFARDKELVAICATFIYADGTTREGYFKSPNGERAKAAARRKENIRLVPAPDRE